MVWVPIPDWKRLTESEHMLYYFCSDSGSYRYKHLVKPPLITRFWLFHSNLLSLQCDVELWDLCCRFLHLVQLNLWVIEWIYPWSWQMHPLQHYTMTCWDFALHIIISIHVWVVFEPSWNWNWLTGCFSAVERNVMFLYIKEVQINLGTYFYISGYQQLFYVNILRHYKKNIQFHLKTNLMFKTFK